VWPRRPGRLLPYDLQFVSVGCSCGDRCCATVVSAKALRNRYLVLVNETCGDAWRDPKWFRFGASSLLNDLLMQWVRLDTGTYQRPEDFSRD